MERLDRNALETRRRHNDEILRRMKTGEPLTAMSSEASWFPPRPMIKKDEELIKRLYAKNEAGEAPMKDRADVLSLRGRRDKE